jgi:catechol 2,3-dioxygenase-like lactoylglutathione lyase family enzyme
MYRRQLLRTLASLPAATTAFGQGRCRDGYETKACPLTQALATAPIKPLFAPTGWKTTALDHISFRVADYKKEAAFYIALMGWKLRHDDGQQAILDIGPWGSAIFKQAPAQRTAAVDALAFVIEPWNAKTIEAELRKRGLNPIADNDGKGFESFHINDPDHSWDLQLCNANGLARARRTPPAPAQTIPEPFGPTGWNTVWLDHLSMEVSNYKASVSFYANLLGWKPTYDEGSQNEVMIGELGDAIIRGGNANDPSFGRGPAPARPPRIGHISFGISPWDTDGVKADLEKRGLRARIDTSTGEDIHTAAFKSYHTTTPNGYDLQISYVTSNNRLTLANAVKP